MKLSDGLFIEKVSDGQKLNKSYGFKITGALCKGKEIIYLPDNNNMNFIENLLMQEK